jgi:quercetin dioxygenase-like cupin family protein
MRKYFIAPNHTDHRGTITDLVTGRGCVDAVTIVHTKAGSIRGNHLHPNTRQAAHIVSGRLFVTDGKNELELGPGDTVIDEPGEPHAWHALEDTVCVVTVQGPRAGKEYESDTIRLAIPLIR